MVINNALVTIFGDALIAKGNDLRGVILNEGPAAPLAIDFERQLLLNAPPGMTLRILRPGVYQLLDAAGKIYFHAPDGGRDRDGERPGWSELTCLSLIRYPDLAPASLADSPIPQRLHFICNDQTTLDTEIAATIERNIALNPGWEIRIWDEAGRFQFISDEYGWDVLKIYLMIGPEYGAAKADFFRYLLIYRLGGVYLDLKSSMSRPLNTILRKNDQYLLSQWNMSGSGRHAGWGIGATIAHVPGGEFQQWFLIARAGHPYLLRVIKLVMTKILSYRTETHGTGAVTTFNVTGPHAYTKAIHPVREQFAHRIFDSETDGLIYSVVENHRERSQSTYREAITPMVTGNESCRL